MATKSIAWNDGSGDHIQLTYSGSGNGSIVVESDPNNLASSRSKSITVETVGGAIVRNLTVSQTACPVPIGTILNYSYTGSVQGVLLPAGTYKLQCWGAQGGSNAAASSYGITAKAGGKGGYSEGVLTLASPTTVYIFVGGQGGSSGNGGWNGGGGGSGSSSYNSGDEQGVSRMGCGGGATDIALVTSSMSYSSYRNNRSSASLLSRMIVAGGGGGGAMCYKKETTTTTTWEAIGTCSVDASGYSDDANYKMDWYKNIGSNTVLFSGAYNYSRYIGAIAPYNPNDWLSLSAGDVIKVTCSSGISRVSVGGRTSAVAMDMSNYVGANSTSVQWTVSTPSTSKGLLILIESSSKFTGTVTVEKQVTTTSTTETNDSQVGFVGGGTSGGGYSSSYMGRQNAAGSGGSFGQGANQTVTNYRYCSGAGGGGWYGGGGGQKSDSSMTYCKYSGGGSGFVNTAASAGNRPSGYTGLQLDSGSTTAGSSSFPKTSGSGNETGHSGNGYARITRLS